MVHSVKATSTICALLMVLVCPIQAKDAPVPVQRWDIADAGGFTVSSPSGWAIAPARFVNAQELILVPALASDSVPAARIFISAETRTDHQEAVDRLQDIEKERPEQVTFLEIGGWPALQRRYTAPLQQTNLGRDSESVEMSVRVTTAVAAGTTLVRLEGYLSPDADIALAGEIEQIARSLAFPTQGEPEKVRNTVETLRTNPRSSSAFSPSEVFAAQSAPAAASTLMSTGANIRVNGFGGVDSEIEVAVSANGQNIVIANNGRDYSFSNDFGSTFSTTAFSPGFPANGDPSLGFAASTSFYFGFIGFPNGTPAALNVTGCSTGIGASTDNGQTFNLRGHAVLCPLSGAGVCFPDQEHIAADRVNLSGTGQDQVYSTWRNFVPAGGMPNCNKIGSGFVTPSIVCSTDGGANWTAPAAIPGGGDFPRITVGQDGTVYVVYRSGANVMLNRYSSCASGLMQAAGFPKVVAPAITDVVCPVPGLDRCNDGNSLSSHTVAVDDTNANHVYVAFAVSAGAGNENVLVRDSVDGGVTWPAASVVTLNSSATGRRFMPWVCATQGIAYATWYDMRAATAANNDLTDFYGGSAFLNAGMLTAGAEFLITEANDALCAPGWPCSARSTNNSESCSIQPQLAGRCLASCATGGGSNAPCDFSDGCGVGETCCGGGGCPKYGDYNGTACVGGRVLAAWASATSPPSVIPASTSIDVFFDKVCCLPAAGITESNPPVVSSVIAVGGDVDANCEYLVAFVASVGDDCCVNADDVTVTVSLLTANATLGTPTILKTQFLPDRVTVAGTVLVSDLTSCPARVQVTVDATDCCGNASARVSTFADVNDTIVPTIISAAASGAVDANCEYLMPFAAVVNDNCCVDADDVAVAVVLVTGNATLGTPTIVKTQVSQGLVTVTGTVLVSDLTSCPAVVAVVVDAVDCCGNAAVQSIAVAQVIDTIPPVIVCPPPITLARGDKLCNDDVKNWLNSATATDNCDTNVAIVDNSAANGFACGFPFGSTTTVTWTATDDCLNTASCSSTITINPASSVSVTEKGSFLAYSKVELKWDSQGRLTQDTFIDIANDFNHDVRVQLYFVNGDAPMAAMTVGSPPIVVEREHLGWTNQDCQFPLSAEQATYFSVLTGCNDDHCLCTPFTALDPGPPVGRPDPDVPGGRMLRGFIYAWAVNNDGFEIRHNHLKGEALIVNYAETAAWEYNAYTFTSDCLNEGEQPLDCTLFDANGTCCAATAIPGRLDLDGFQYSFAFDRLLLDFYATGSDAFSTDANTVMLDTSLTLYVVDADLRQESFGPITTKAKFDIWNQEEFKRSGTERCITCWDQTPFSRYTAFTNNFLISNLHTDKGKARIDGLQSFNCAKGICAVSIASGHLIRCTSNAQCPAASACIHDPLNQASPLLGVAHKRLVFSGVSTGVDYAGTTLYGTGQEATTILYDPSRSSQELLAPAESDATDGIPLPVRKPNRESGH